MIEYDANIPSPPGSDRGRELRTVEGIENLKQLYIEILESAI